TCAAITVLAFTAGWLSNRLSNRHAVRRLTAALDEARRRLLRDRLTGLYNRDGLLTAHAADAAARPGRAASVVLIDIDGFKQINDVLGHAAGDDLLTEVARRIDEAARLHLGVAARLSGDEFAAWLPLYGNLDRAADMFVTMIAQPVTLTVDGDPITVVPTASVGISLTSTSVPCAAALRLADIAMYHAKTAGGARRVVFHRGMTMPHARGRRGPRLRDLHGHGPLEGYEPGDGHGHGGAGA
ncbi:GGDEF domain-containing protein, partial [Actinoplanes sp. NPDC051633]|uniref:GGDEF domain-containing protein n=1 Tax=Actinoplanes sp. NPDC051633 TaxID=3155670 RepID=UPI003432A445